MKSIKELFQDNRVIVTLIYIIVMLFLFFPKTVKFVPNEHLVNVTDANTNKTVTVAALYYEREARVPIKTIGKNDENILKPDDLFIWLVLTIVFVVLLFNQDKGKLMTMDEIKKKAHLELSSRADVDHHVIMEQAFLIETQIDDANSVPTDWVVFCSAELNSKLGEMAGQYLLANYYNPYNGFKKNTIRMKEFPDGFRPRCEICGNFPNKKLITPEGWKHMLDQMGLKATSK
jgi:hypothetical protein